MIDGGTHGDSPSVAPTRKEILRERMEATRAQTLALMDRVPDAFLKVRVHDFYSPIGWHFGHIGRTEELWACETALGKPALDDALSLLFVNVPENPKDGRVNLPSRDEIVAYLAETRQRALDALDEAEIDGPEASPLLRDGYAWEFARLHECQHQETIVEMLMLIRKAAGDFPLPPAPSPRCHLLHGFRRPRCLRQRTPRPQRRHHRLHARCRTRQREQVGGVHGGRRLPSP